MGVLPGITRDSIMTFAKESGLTIKEERLTRDELYIADEMFLCGTAAEVTPVRELDHRKIGNGEVGRVTRFLSERFHDVVQAKIERYKGWLTFL
jgi:branched-chain amino acid aminotransferase